MAASPTSPTTIDVFYSYAHKDKGLLGKLITHLTMLKRQAVIRDWHDRMITAGTEWKGQIDAHLNSAGVILLLVSADFIASDYCYDIELKRALERHEMGEARVIPVILRPVDNWQAAPFGKLQAAPTSGRPITSWHNRDAAFADVAAHIRRAVDELRKPPNGLETRIALLVVLATKFGSHKVRMDSYASQPLKSLFLQAWVSQYLGSEGLQLPGGEVSGPPPTFSVKFFTFDSIVRNNNLNYVQSLDPETFLGALKNEAVLFGVCSDIENGLPDVLTAKVLSIQAERDIDVLNALKK